MSEQPDAGDEASVLLDIGGDVGALVLLTPDSLLGVEIEISPLDSDAVDVFQQEHPHVPEDVPHEHGPHTHTHHHAGRTHVMVRSRRTPAGVIAAAVYPGLRAGSYQLWSADNAPAETVRINGGEVVEIDWR